MGFNACILIFLIVNKCLAVRFDMESAEKTGVPLTVSQRAEQFVKMKEQLPLETTRRLTEAFIRFLTSPETSTKDRKEVFLTLKSTLDPASMRMAVNSFNLDIKNLQLSIDERIAVFNLMRLFVQKRELIDVLNLFVGEIASEKYELEKRCSLYKSLKEFLSVDMCVAIAKSFLIEVQKEDSNSAQCRELFLVSKPYLTHDSLMEFVKAFVKHLVNRNVAADERRLVYQLIKSYFSSEVPFPLEGFIYDIKMPGATHHDRKEAFTIIKPYLNTSQCKEMATYFKVDFVAHDLPPQKRVLLFSLIKTYLIGETLDAAITALLRDLELHELSVEERLELLSNLRRYLTPVQLNFAIRTFIIDITSPVTRLTRCIDAFKLLESHLSKKEMIQLAKPMLEKMHIRLLTTEERKEGLMAIEQYLVKNKQKEDVNEALMLGVLDIKSDLKSRVRLYIDLKKALTKEQREKAITSLFKAHKDPEIPRKQREQFLRVFETDIPKSLLLELDPPKPVRKSENDED